jgi:hypothetical protein
MVLDGLDILCALPRNKIKGLGTPFVCNNLKFNLPDSEKDKLCDMFWPHFKQQLLPIIKSWDLIGKDSSPVEIDNHTINAPESLSRCQNVTPNFLLFW